MTATTIRVQMAQRSDTAANWTSANPILLSGEIGYETDTEKFKIGDGTTNWNSLAYLPIPDGSGNLTITGNLEIGTTGTLTFEGSTADGFETTLAVTDPTADRTITLPDVSGTVVTTGDTGSVTSTMIADGTIVDADVSVTAEISVSKLANGTANQVLVTDGTDVSWSDDLTLAGNLTVNGTTTTVNTETLVVEDKNIELGVVGTPTDVTADGGGITLKGTTDKTINWVDATDAWTFSEHIDLASAKEFRIAGTKVLDATSLGSAVVSSSLTSVGTISSGTWQGTAIDAAYLDSTVVTTSDTGTVTSTMILDGTIVNADVNASAAIAGTKIDPDFGSQTIETTGVINAGSGTAAAPSVSVGTTDNGLYSPGTDQVAISTNGTQRINIEADGDINIDSGGVFYDATSNQLAVGTTSPTNDFVVSNGGAAGFEVNPTVGVGVLYYNRSTSQYVDATHDCNQFIVTRSSSERARIDSAGRLLVGTSSTPVAIESITPQLVSSTDGSLNGDVAIYSYRNAGGSGRQTIAPRLFFARSRSNTNGSIGGIVNNNEDIGNIRFAADDGTQFLTAAEILAEVDGTPGTDDMPGRLVFSVTADGSASPSEAMRINNAGELLVGYTSDNGAYKLQVNSQIFATSATIATSDGRYKENVATLDGCVDLVKALRPVSFDWKHQEPITRIDEEGETVVVREAHNFPDGTQVGFIAQEVETVFADKPWLGSVIKQNVRPAVTDADGNELAPEEEFLGIAEGNLVAVLTSALKDAIGEIESLKARVAALEAS